MKSGFTNQFDKWETIASAAARDLAAIRADFGSIKAVVASTTNQEWHDIKNLLSHNRNITQINLETSRNEVIGMYRATGRLPTSDMDILRCAAEYQSKPS